MLDVPSSWKIEDLKNFANGGLLVAFGLDLYRWLADYRVGDLVWRTILA
jgi:hypothetical protein